MWAWLGISLAILLGWAYYKNKTSSQSTPTDTANASQVPQFVNQTYTTVGPPTTTTHADSDGKKKKPGDPCPGDMYWDPDANGGKGKCVKEPEPKKKPHEPPPRRRRPEPRGDK